jgi:hypothetical protein
MFLDREPYIRWWRPTYRVLGPAIRSVKSVVQPGSLFRGRVPIEGRLADLEAAQHQFQTALEQMIIATMADRQVLNALTNLESRLAEMRERTTQENEAQWAALEQLLSAFMGGAGRAHAGRGPIELLAKTHSAGSARETVA